MKKYLLATLFFLFTPLFVGGESFSIIITEVAWMGTQDSANDEWIELYNNNEESILLEGWFLKTADEKLIINLKNSISPRGFYLLERTDDTTILDVESDLIYKGALNNNGEYLEIYDNLNNLIDRVDCSTEWFNGDNTTKQTMERIDFLVSGSNPLNWQTSQNPGGTPKEVNSAGHQTPTLLPNPSPDPLIAPVVDQTAPPQLLPAPLIYPSNIIFSEILPSPEGPDETEEWIEVCNRNDLEVNLENWQIQDSEGNTTVYTFPDGATIKQKGYLVIKRPTTKIILNNTGDRLILLNPNKEVADTVEYTKAPQNQSYNRMGDEWRWSGILTPGLTNTVKNETIEKTKEIILDEKLVAAAINAPLKEPKPFLYTFLIALAFASASITIFLFLKAKLNNK